MTDAHALPTVDTVPSSAPPRRRLSILRADALTIRRRRAGRGFFYVDDEGRRIDDESTLERIRALAIPPAYRDVRIAADPRGHLQAVGYDEAGRIQHRYHADWNAVRERRKARRLAVLVSALPRIRAAVARDLASARPTRDAAAACAVALIDETHIRVGCEAYTRTNGSHGAATLLKSHVEVAGGEVRLAFRGKGGKAIACTVRHGPLAKALTRLRRLPGRRLLAYADAGGTHALTAADVNAYLRRIAGAPVSAKDFRGLAASAGAAEDLLAVEPGTSETARKRQLAGVMKRIAERLSNTPAVVHKSYVHASVVTAFLRGRLKTVYRQARATKGRKRIEAVLGRLV